MSKHTPGPWRFIEEPKHPSLAGVQMPNGKEVGYRAALSEPEEVANAHLIAAAPEMLDALKWSLAALKCQVPGNPAAEYCACSGCKASDLARAAVAKAEGRSA